MISFCILNIFFIHFRNILSENPDWSTIQQRFGKDGEFSNIFGVINLILTLSPSSADAERGFSQLKLLKTELRTNLGQYSLNNCLAIKLLSPCINSFNPEESVNYWVNSSTRSRRPNLKDKSSTSATSCNVIVDLVQQPSTSSQSEIVQSESDSATAIGTDCDIPCCDTDRGVNREQDINNILDKMEDLRQDIFDDSDDDIDYDSDEIEDSVVQKLLSL